MGTPHINAEPGDVAKRVLMPGDPLRAEYIAKNFLTDARKFNNVRNMFGFTGTYKGKEISVMGSGMGIPSIGIYSHELYTQFGVEEIIRIGSAGGFQDDIGLKDVVIGMGACTDSNFAAQYALPGTFAPVASFELLESAVKTARDMGLKVHVGNVLSSDVFYTKIAQNNEKWRDMGVLAVEMEAAALYMTAAYLKKKALCIATISDHIFKEGILSAEERETGFNNMIEIALNMD